MKRVLVVDDAIFMRTSIKLYLERNGFEVAGEAANGLDAVKRYKELKPDIVTMDITMPEMDGLQALEQLMRFDPEANIVMITALGQENHVKDAILLGAKGFVVKPFTEEQLVKSLRHFA